MRLHCVIAMLLLAIQFAADPATAADKFTNIHTMGVISSFDDKFSLTKIGNFVFSNSRETVPIEDWKLNEIVAQYVSTALRNRFTVQTIASDPNTFKQESSTYRDWKKKRFVSMPENSGIDAYVMILPSEERDPLGTGTSIAGLGFLNHARPFGTPKLALYAIYKVYIIDAETGSRIDYGSAQVPDSAFLSSPSPYAAMEEAQWIESAATMSDNQKAGLKSQIMDLITKSIPYAFYNANLPLR